MDKNYNVDDILSEIKSRKSREKGAPPPAGGTARREEFDFTAPIPNPGAFQKQPDTPPVQEGGFDFAPPEDLSRPDLGTQGQTRQPPARNEGFQFTPADADEPAHKSNPMDFSGHVRPLTDKARMRPGRLNQPPGQRPAAQPRFDFQPGDRPPESPRPPLDFSSFSPGADEDIPADDGHTRVLPKFRTGRTPIPDDGDLDFEAIHDQAEGYYEEEYQDDLPEHSSIDFSEYNSVKDRKDVARDIARVKLWLFIRTFVTAILTGALFYYTLAGKIPSLPLPTFLFPEPETMRNYLIACTLMTVLVAIVNSSAVGGGLSSLFKMRANSDTLASLAVLAAAGQGVAAVVNPEGFNPEAMNLYYSVAALSMFFNALGKMTMMNRIQANFRIIGSERSKKAVLTVESDEFCREFVPEATTRRPTVAFTARAGFFTDFLALSYSDKYDVGVNRAVAPVCLAGALVVGISSYFLTSDMSAAISALTAVLCVCATLSATFVENIPLGKLTKKLAPQGGMVSGNKAVETFCDTKALVLNETDLFPKGNVKLLGIKAFSQGRIDEAILDAASVVCSLEGSLSDVFLQMIGNNKKLLKKVDNVVFENGMGVSAWVDSRRVLIGNRLLMQNHGITMPAAAVQAQTLGQSDGEVLYLSNSGEVSAQFAVGYQIDEELAGELDQLASKEVALIVYTTDANITAHRLWELYGYPEELIRILPAERHPQYRQMSAPRDTAVAELAYTGRAATLVKAILACMNARSSILSATMIQLVQIVLGYGLVAFMAFMGAIDTLTITQLCIYQGFWFLAIFIVQKIRQS